MLETGLFFLLSWSAFLSAEAAGLTGQCFVLSSPLDVWIPVFPAPHQVPLPDPAGVKWIVSESASPGYPGEKKKKMHPLYDSLIGSFQSVDSSSVLTGQEGDVEIYEWPMYCWMMALHLGSLHAECEGMHGAFVGMNAGFPFTRRSLWVCTWPHPTVFKNLCLHSVANQKTGR